MFSALKDDFTQILTVFQNGNETICKRKEELDLSSLKIEDYAGTYYCEELDISYLFFIEDEKLKMKIANYESQELSLYEMDAFTSDGNLVRFNRSNGAIKGFELDAGRVTNLKFVKN